MRIDYVGFTLLEYMSGTVLARLIVSATWENVYEMQYDNVRSRCALFCSRAGRVLSLFDCKWGLEGRSRNAKRYRFWRTRLLGTRQPFQMSYKVLKNVQ